MIYTLGTAAKATGYTKPTIRKAISDGKLSATKNEQGHYQIDSSELQRVYPLEMRQVETEKGEEPVKIPPKVDGALQGQIDALERLISAKDDQLATIKAERDRVVEDKEREAKIADELRRKVDAAELRLLTYEQESSKPEPVKRRWWKLGNG